MSKLIVENYNAWFRRNKVKLKGKTIFYVCERNLKKHYKSTTARELLEALEELNIVDNKTAKTCINIDKREKYLEN
jgi:hypothetical protein